MVNETAKRVAGAAIVFIVLLTGGFFGWGLWLIEAGYRDYDQVSECLEQNGFEVETGWQHKDVVLEDFGLTFQLDSGQAVEIQILDGYSPRDCRSSVMGMFVSGEGLHPKERHFLRFDQPDLVADLNGEQMQTMGDAIARLDWLLEWASEHPNAFVDADGAGDRTQYFTLMSPPL